MRMALVLITACLLSPVAKAENYGGNAPAEKRRMVRLIHREFGYGWLGRTMVCIARRESGLNPRAANYQDTRGGSFGLLQLNGVHSPTGYAYRAWIHRMWLPKQNLRRAHRLYRAEGLGPWGGGC